MEGAAAQKNDNAKRYTEVIEPATKKFKGNTNEISDYDVLQYVESLETDGSDQIDEGHIKKMILIYEKRVLKNREMRIKFVDTAEKFMESELELFESIQVFFCEYFENNAETKQNGCVQCVCCVYNNC